MAKPPRIRQGRDRKDPLTIDLDAEDVQRLPDENIAPAAGPAGEPPQPPASEPAPMPPDPVITAEPQSSPGEEPGEVKPAAAEEAAHAVETAEAEDQAPPATQPDTQQAAEDGRRSLLDDQPDVAETRRDPRPAEPAGPPPPAPPSGVPAARRGGAGTALIAGLAGGILALLVAAALQYFGLLPSAQPAQVARPAPDTALEDQLAALENRVAALQAGGGAAAAKPLADLGARVDGLDRELDQVKSDVVALQGTGAAPATAGSADNPDLKALSDKVAALEQLGANGGADMGAVTSLTQRLATLEAALKAATAAASTNEGRIAGLEKNLQSVEQGVGDLSGKVSAQAGQPKAALAIAVAGLKAALEQGGPFTAEVETFAAVVPDAPDLAGLRAVAAAAIASRQELASQAPEVAGAMIDAGQPVPDDAGLVSRFLASAESLVKVRPVGPVAGNGVPERVSRWLAAIRSGDFAAAVSEYQALPDGAKAAGAAFMDKVQARLKAEQLVDKMSAEALKA